QVPVAVISLTKGAPARRVPVAADLVIQGSVLGNADATRGDELLAYRSTDSYDIPTPVGGVHLDTGAFEQLGTMPTSAVGELRWITAHDQPDEIAGHLTSGYQVYFVREDTHEVSARVGLAW